MAAERRDHDHESEAPSSNAAGPRRAARTDSGRGLEGDRVSAVGSASERHRSVPLEARIERTRLELRIVALERALETSERRRQAVIDRYERLLANRTASETQSSPDDTDSLLTRLFGP